MRFARARLATGPQIHYAEHGDSRGAATVFIHGWPDSWFSWSQVLPLLPSHRRALAIDQRGFGDSEKPASGYAIEDFALDVVAFLDALSIERAALVGHSFGSFVARQVAIAHPERVTHLALIGTAVSARNPVTLEVQAAMRDLPDPVSIEFAREFNASTVYVPVPEAFFDRMVKDSLKLPSRLWRAVFDGILAYDDTSSVARIAAPTLLLWGDRDGLFPREDQDRLVEAIPQARLVVYPETGHCPNWERPEQVAAHLGDFLEST